MLRILGDEVVRITMKLVGDTASDRVVGYYIVRNHAAESVQSVGIALQSGATSGHFDAPVGIQSSAAKEFVTMRN